MTQWRVFYCFVACLCSYAEGTPTSTQQNQQKLNLKRFFSNHKCGVRYLQVMKYIHKVNCTEMAAVNEICGRKLSVAYLDVLPYAMTSRNRNGGGGSRGEGGDAKGIIQELLKEIFNTCCMGCNSLHFQPINKSDHLFLDETIPYDMVIPIENSKRNNNRYMSHYWAEVITLKTVSYFYKEYIVSPDQQVKWLILGTLKTSPVLLLAIIIAVCVGCVIWVLESWHKNQDFTRSFPRGIFEGFWWAYVSMTTVGYGDLTPRSTPARVLAVIWILLGIVLFDMYTASLTSFITTQMSAAGQQSMKAPDLTFGRLKNTEVITATFQKHSHVVKEYDGIDELLDAFERGEIKKFALEDHMVTYYKNKLDEYEMVELKRDLVHQFGLGLVTDNKNISTMVHSFVDANLDILLKIVINSLTESASEDKEEKSHDAMNWKSISKIPFPTGSEIFLWIVGASAIFAVASVVIGGLLMVFCKL